MKTVLVTGGSGLVGQAIRNVVSNDQGYTYVFVSSAQYDLVSMEDTRRMYREHMPHTVIHLAACVGGLFKNMNNKVEMLEKNLLINFNVVRCAHEHGVKKLVACLSTCIFPDSTTYPINETMLHNGAPHHSNDAYAYAKRMLEIQCCAYRENYGCDFGCVIPTNIYGPHDNYHLEDAHVIPALIHKCYLAKKQGVPFVVRGTGKPLRQFVYSLDLAQLIVHFSRHTIPDGCIILSVPEKDEVSIEYVARVIACAYDYEAALVFDGAYADGQFKKTADNTKMARLVDFHFTTVEEGIQDSVAWFVRNYENARK